VRRTVLHCTGSLGLFGLLLATAGGAGAAATDGEGSGTPRLLRSGGRAAVLGRPTTLLLSPVIKQLDPWFPNFEISNLYGPPPLGPKRWCIHACVYVL
jgi:hypothetical protein